jgi:hypothetical protein
MSTPYFPSFICSMLFVSLLLIIPIISFGFWFRFVVGGGFGGRRLGFLGSLGFLLRCAFLRFVLGAGLVFVVAAAGFVFLADFGGLWFARISSVISIWNLG